jgi:hypothetical protein
MWRRSAPIDQKSYEHNLSNGKSGSRRNEIRKGDIPMLLLGSDASTLSEDPNVQQ